MTFDPQFFGFVAFAVVVVAILVWNLVCGGFSKPIASTPGEVCGKSSALARAKIKVHKLGGHDADAAVGLAVSVSTIGSFRLMHVTLSAGEAKKMVTLLQSAIAER